ncbi:hypothetical protein CROQUDRAFT_664292 [Cronartium quercuum f. sp. fusiforme G11]|uniref:Translin n=1 Tax=Cronartium quercuum f. sp. fusiforme G11 TaxID=708437 RepID=A0A9P6T6K8_9BASI|nr:hypothetical protein CROQUDRAFT_664292 [Cronartium quercuum f. sp. fusiforme G11]
MSGVPDLSHLQDAMDAEHEVRDRIKESVRGVEKHLRAINGFLNQVHGSTLSQNSELLKKADAQFPELNNALAALAKLIPEGQYWRYNDCFTRTLQHVAFITIYHNWLSINLCTNGTFDKPHVTQTPVASLLQKQDVIEILGLKEPLTLTTEEYLHGLISLINELTRLSINIVTLGMYQVPIAISQFCKDLSVGFSMLNLKNDSLRKRYDSIKYDLKRLEEVVYDITLRGLCPPQPVAQEKKSVS